MIHLKHIPLSQLPGKKTKMKLVPLDKPVNLSQAPLHKLAAPSLKKLTKIDLARLANQLAKALLREKAKQKELKKQINALIKQVDGLIAYHDGMTDD